MYFNSSGLEGGDTIGILAVVVAVELEGSKAGGVGMSVRRPTCRYCACLPRRRADFNLHRLLHLDFVIGCSPFLARSLFTYCSSLGTNRRRAFVSLQEIE